MPCYHPLQGYRSKWVNPDTGKRSIVFNVSDGFADMPVSVPCGRCTGCRLEYSRQWAIRCMHEAQCHESNSFLTLTYANEHLPEDMSISKGEMQRFMKRLRKEIGVKVRYFLCGEYGEKNNRPHYHVILFGYDFSSDRYLHTKTKTGELLYRSPTLERVWPYGHSLIGSVSFESAAYVARYVMKKRKGKADEVDRDGVSNEEHYRLLDTETGEVHSLEPEFCLMSRRPGLGAKWLQEFKSDTDKDFITFRGKKMKLPKYYDSVLAIEDEASMLERKWERKRKAAEQKEDSTYERLGVREAVKQSQIVDLKRGYENFED